MFRGQPERLRLRYFVQEYFTKEEKEKASNDWMYRPKPFHINKTLEYYDPDWKSWFPVEENHEHHYVDLPEKKDDREKEIQR